MRGLVFLGNRKLELQEFPDPVPGAGEVVLAMKASGMCGSDDQAEEAYRLFDTQTTGKGVFLF